LRFTPASIATVGVLLGVLFLFGMIDEFLIAAVVPSWRWLHAVMGVIFAFGAGWSFARPYDAFWTLASILGLLLIFRGTLDIITSVDARGINGAWWLGMAAGILEILLGFWASQQYLSVKRGAAAGLDRVVRLVPRDLRDRHRLRSPQPLTGLAATAVPDRTCFPKVPRHVRHCRNGSGAEPPRPAVLPGPSIAPSPSLFTQVFHTEAIRTLRM
jgi:hypothetical protein